MSEIMRPMSFSELMEHALGEYARSGSVFGVRASKFWRGAAEPTVEPSAEPTAKLANPTANPAANPGSPAEPTAVPTAAPTAELFGSPLDVPIGPAAGPGSQLAGNILAAYLAGARFIELKTVQTLDGAELRAAVARPCINATDECYNVEWSTELTVQQALEQYVRAWVAIHVLGREFGLGTGVIFNISVGYSLKGIQSKKIDDYLNSIKDASKTAVWAECTTWLRENIGRFLQFSLADLQKIPAQVSNSITLSTLHGCPAKEIERIADYLLAQKRLNTYVKCNPTLLGYQAARHLLDESGFDYLAFDEHHFVEDLQFDDAVAMFKRLLATGEKLGLAVGAKITNTFPVQILRGELPGDEMYMSGRALFPLSLTVATRLATATDGKLPISYSGGADAFNLAGLLKLGIRPITVATTILKPGGYERLQQLAKIASLRACEGESCGETRDKLREQNAAPTSPQNPDFRETSGDSTANIDVEALSKYLKLIRNMTRYQKSQRPGGSRKSSEPLPLFDCAQAPCAHPASAGTGGCPIEQQIPAYLEQVGKGQLQAAFKIIANDNVLPSITGTICDHQCQNRCTRLDYDDSLQIRAAKKTAATAAQAAFSQALTPATLRSDARVLVIGAGPAGLAAASYLRRNGVNVTVREQRDRPLGIVGAVIPAFRISSEELALDIKLAEAWGVTVEYGAEPGYDLAALRQNYDFVILATGAWKQGRSDLPVDDVRVIDALDFLERSKASNLTLSLGQRVAVIGGGDVAMDCARAAARNVGVQEASIVYRRTRGQMPAQPAEIELAQAEGVHFIELAAPRAFADGKLSCDIMQLGELDASGRRSVAASGRSLELAFDTVISAVGAAVDYAPMVANGLVFAQNGRPLISATNQSSIAGIYLAGDCKAGPKTVVQAMADAKLIARDILSQLGLEPDFQTFALETCRDELLAKKGILAVDHPDSGQDSVQNSGQDSTPDSTPDLGQDSARCLGCNQVCEVCVDVCPNRANVAILTNGSYQIVHIDRLCNECGNCTTFCPTGGDPYKDKFTVFLSQEDFFDSTNRGFLPLASGGFRLRLKNGEILESELDDASIPPTFTSTITTISQDYPYLLGSQIGAKK